MAVKYQPIADEYEYETECHPSPKRKKPYRGHVFRHRTRCDVCSGLITIKSLIRIDSEHVLIKSVYCKTCLGQNKHQVLVEIDPESKDEVYRHVGHIVDEEYEEEVGRNAHNIDSSDERVKQAISETNSLVIDL